MLTNIDLANIAKQMKINLIAVVSKDELKNVAPKQGGYIINMQDSTDGSGTHWSAMCVYEDDSSYKCLYFDSYGFPAATEIEDFCKRISPYRIAYNTKQIQKTFTTDCGWYTLSWLFNMQYKRKYDDMIKDYERYIGMFTKNLTEDLIILKKSQMKIEFKIFICVKIMNIKILIFNFINYLIFL